MMEINCIFTPGSSDLYILTIPTNQCIRMQRGAYKAFIGDTRKNILHTFTIPTRRTRVSEFYTKHSSIAIKQLFPSHLFETE